MLTGDENIIDTQFVVFENSGRGKFLQGTQPECDKAAAESAMREIIGKSSLILPTTGRGKITDEVKNLIQKTLTTMREIILTQIEIQGIEPPAAVIDAFKDVAAAKQDAERAENEATAYRNEVTQRAAGEAAQVIAAAEAYKEEQIAKATGETQRFLSVYKEYVEDKDVTRRRLYLETMEEVLEGMDKVLLEENAKGGSGVVPISRLELRKDARG